MLFEPAAQRVIDERLDHRAHLGGDQLVLGLGGELRVGHFHGEHAGQALAAIVTGQIDLFLLRQAGRLRIGGDLPGQGAAQARQMGTAVALGDVVGEGQHILVIAVVPPHRHFDADAVAVVLDHDGLDELRRLRAVEIAHEGFQAALIEQILDLHFRMARVGQHHMHAGVQEGEFAQAMFDGAIIEVDHGEGFCGRQEGDLRAALGLAVQHRRGADGDERGDHVTMGEFDEELLFVAPDAQLQPLGKRVDDRDAYAMQAAGDLVGILVELTARMQLGHDDLGRRHTLFVVDVGGDAAPVVGHGAGAVGVQRHGDEIGVARQRLVDGVVDHFVDHVMQTGAVVRIADIHARPFAHGVEAAQNLDGISAIGVGRGGIGRGQGGCRFGHESRRFRRALESPSEGNSRISDSLSLI